MTTQGRYDFIYMVRLYLTSKFGVCKVAQQMSFIHYIFAALAKASENVVNEIELVKHGFIVGGMVESYFLEPEIMCLVRTPPTRILRVRLNIQVYMVPMKERLREHTDVVISIR